MPENPIYKTNLDALTHRFPLLSKRLESVDIETVGAINTKDNGICYVIQNESGQWQALTNVDNPILTAQNSIRKMEDRVTKGLSPAVIVGLRPGYELDIIYNHFESRLKYHEPFRHIYVIIDSIHCLAAWLQVADRRQYLKKAEVEFYWHEDINKIVELCETEVQRSHLFVPVSSLSEDHCNKIIEPLAELFVRREAEKNRYHEENQVYYNSISDEDLAKIIRGKSDVKPRLLMPTHATSTVVQYSARDTCAAFEKIGWETEILRVERDLSPWRVAKLINEYKPHLLIFINHLRTEDREIYPENLMFITWVQDSVTLINNKDTATEWNDLAQGLNPLTNKPRMRDLIIGYVEPILKYNYDADLLYQTGMIVDTDIFKKNEHNDKYSDKFRCDLCFASNHGKPTEVVIEEDLLPVVGKFGITLDILSEMHDELWRYYRAGKTCINYRELELRLNTVTEFNSIYEQLSLDDQDSIMQDLFWKLNDNIYRHVVLEWCDDLGLKLNLYGRGWETHSRFNKYACGVVEHGAELSAAYSCADYCLHLNCNERDHQRIQEIKACGGTIISRRSKAIDSNHDKLKPIFHKISLNQFSDDRIKMTDAEHKILNTFLFSTAQDLLLKTGDMDLKELSENVLTSLHRMLAKNLTFSGHNPEYLTFNTKKELADLIIERKTAIDC